MTGKLLAWLAAALVLAGGYLLALDVAKGVRSSQEDRGGGPVAEGPQIVLRGVEMVEARRGGAVYRLVSGDASYKIPSGWVFANRVTLRVEERGGGIVVSAPVASWRMSEGRIDLDQGAHAENGRGWSASAPKASVDLQSEVIVAEEASLSGPGVTVVGSNLRWSWQDGAVALDSPRSTIHPENVPGAGRKGRT